MGTAKPVSTRAGACAERGRAAAQSVRHAVKFIENVITSGANGSVVLGPGGQVVTLSKAKEPRLFDSTSTTGVTTLRPPRFAQGDRRTVRQTAPPPVRGLLFLLRSGRKEAI